MFGLKGNVQDKRVNGRLRRTFVEQIKENIGVV